MELRRILAYFRRKNWKSVLAALVAIYGLCFAGATSAIETFSIPGKIALSPTLLQSRAFWSFIIVGILAPHIALFFLLCVRSGEGELIEALFRQKLKMLKQLNNDLDVIVKELKAPSIGKDGTKGLGRFVASIC